MTKLLFILLFLSVGVYSQTKTVNASGDTIILHEDGTWEKIGKTAAANRDPGSVVGIETKKTSFDCRYIKQGKDDFTGVYSLVTTSEEIASTTTNKPLKAILGSFTKDGLMTLSLYLTLSQDIGCETKDTEVIILFEDKTTLTIEYDGETNCDENFLFVGNITNSLETLQKKKLEKIRLSAESNVDFEVTNKTYFIDRLKCVNR